MDSIARIDTFRAVTDPKISATCQAGFRFQNGNTHVLRNARIDGRLIDDNRTGREISSDDGRCVLHRIQIRCMVRIDGCRDRHHMKTRFTKSFFIRGKIHRSLSDDLISYLHGRVNPASILEDSSLVMIKTDYPKMPGEFHRQRHSHIPKPNDGETRLSLPQSFIDTI